MADPIDMNGCGFIIVTDATNKFNLDEPYKKTIGFVLASEITSTKPRIEIICIDETNYKFIVTVK